MRKPVLLLPSQSLDSERSGRKLLLDLPSELHDELIVPVPPHAVF